MLENLNELFEVFDRDDFTYRIDRANASEIKKSYTTQWNKWKHIVSEALKASSLNNFIIDGTENWQNSGALSKRFWSRIKKSGREDSASCIAAMVNKINFRVYLEWHRKATKHSSNSLEEHNNWINSLEEWITEENINISHYVIWTSEYSDYESYPSLYEFFNNKETKNKIMKSIQNSGNDWIRIGVLLSKNEVQNLDLIQELANRLNELEWIYDKTQGGVLKKINTNALKEVSNTRRIHGQHQITLKKLISHIDSYIKSKGFYYRLEEVTNLILSLKTKPFVILFGISGTGKTMIVRWFAEALGANEENGQFTIIPVRPDWSDGSDLLGYTDIKGDFKEGPLTKVIKEANLNSDKPYIVLLDEMNLARVEYYFSDILSVMESRSFNDDGKIETSTILKKEVAGENIYLPANLYIIGTVNMDETTHPFSKKVLDRANTIEFNRVQLDYLDFLQEIEAIEPVSVKQEVLESKYIHLKDIYEDNPDIVHQVTQELEKVNKVLKKLQAHVGYRVRDEICMYIAYSEENQVMKFDQAMDHCLLQKILPRISGSDSRVKDVLDDLLNICAPPFDLNEEKINLTYAKYPKSAEKLIEMRRRLVDGFTSFWIS